MGKVKRSMAVRPSPIVVQPNGFARLPTNSERYDYDHRGNKRYKEWTGEWGYLISRVTNSTEYRPGFVLTRDQVNKLINDDWTVSVLSKV
jgi:hypothetical protein